MKKIMNIFVLVAAAAMALASCQTQELEDPTPKEYEYIFEIGNADEEDTPETSATLGDTCVEWEEVDQIGVYTDGQNGVSYNRYGNVTLGSTVTFTISSYYALVAGDMVHCYYPYVKTNSQDPKTVELSIPTSQTEKNQMPMVSLPYAVTEALDEKTDSDKSSGEIKFANLGSVIEFHVYSTTAAYQSEKITSVTFNADQAIAGDFEFDLTAVNYSNEETLEISGYTEKSVVATLATPVAVPATRETAKVVKIVVAPGSYTGNVVVATDKAIYTYPITSAKNFQRSVVMPLGLNLRENVREALVASTATLSSEEIKTTIAASKCAYGAEVVYDDALDGVVWKSTCLTDAAGRPWLQMKSDKTVYIAIESDGNIEEVVVTVTSASNSSGGVLDISKHETFTGTLSLNTAADGSGTNVASGEATDNIVTLVPNSANKTLYLKTNAGARVWNIEVKKLGVVSNEPSVGASDVAGISARGVENEELNYTIVNPNGSQLSLECDGTVVTAVENIDDTIKYTVSANMTGEIRQGNITINYGETQKVVKISQNASVFKASRLEVELEADADASAQVTITNDFDWTSELSSDKFTISPAEYKWSEGGKQTVVIKTKSANESAEGTITLGAVTFTSVTGQKVVVTVKQKSSYVDPSASTATLTFDDTSKRTSFSSTKQVWEENGITFTNNKSSSQSDVGDYSKPIRLYKGSNVVISMTENCKMSKIVFSSTSSTYAGYINQSIGNIATVSGNDVTLILDTPVSSYTISSIAAATRLQSITVTYTSGASGGETPDPEPDEGGESVTVSNTIAQIASSNSWENGTKYSSFNLDDNITATATGGGNTGKYYTSGNEWRIYQTETPKLTITAAEGYTIETVKITYNYSKAGVLTLGTSNIASKTTVSVNAASVEFGVGNTGSATDGQVKVTQIEVVYHADN